MERRRDPKNGHNDGLVLLVDEDLHVSDVLFSGHLRHVLIGHVGLPGPGEKKKREDFIKEKTHVGIHGCSLLCLSTIQVIFGHLLNNL